MQGGGVKVCTNVEEEPEPRQDGLRSVERGTGRDPRLYQAASTHRLLPAFHPVTSRRTGQ